MGSRTRQPRWGWRCCLPWQAWAPKAPLPRDIILLACQGLFRSVLIHGLFPVRSRDVSATEPELVRRGLNDGKPSKTAADYSRKMLVMYHHWPSWASLKEQRAAGQIAHPTLSLVNSES